MRTPMLLITCCTLFLGNLHAQVPDWSWATSINGPGYDYIQALTTDAEGNVYCTGGFTSPSITLGSFTLTNSSNPNTFGDLFVAKVAPDGTVLWAMDTDGPHGEGGNAIALDHQGNIYVLGGFGGIDFTYAGSTFTSQGASDLLLVKYAPSGTPLWARKAGSTGQDDPSALTIDPDGNAIISGQWQGSTLTVGSFTTSNAGGLDNVYAKYDPDGTLLWATSFGGTGVDFCSGLATDALGNIYSAGSFYSTTLSIGGTTLTNNGSNDLYVAKFTPGGTAVWAYSAGGSGAESVTGLLFDGAGSLVISGVFLGDDLTLGATTLTNASAGDQEMYLTRFTTDGEPLWATSLGITGADWTGRQIGMDGGGNIYLPIGYEAPSITVGVSTLTNVDGVDTFVAKFTPDGVPIWAAAAGGAGYESPQGITTDPEGNVYVCGYYQGGFPLTIGTTALPASASYDSFLARLGDFNVGVAGTGGATGLMGSYWNAGIGELRLRSSATSAIDCTVYTAQGARVAGQRFVGSTTLQLQEQSPGVYVVVLRTGEQQQTLKLIRE